MGNKLPTLPGSAWAGGERLITGKMPVPPRQGGRDARVTGASRRGGGFSLIEVLFAVMIITLGLIFVAAQFPMGLATSRGIADRTLGAVNANNAKVLIELELRAVGADNALDDRDGAHVHALAKPNILANSLTGDISDVVLVVDDPEGLGLGLDTPIWPFWSDGVDYTEDFIGDIGRIMMPMVDESSGAVQQLVFDGVDIETAIFTVAMQQRYHWGALYNGRERIFYIFTFRVPQPGTRYGEQTPATRFENMAGTANAYASSAWPGNWPVPVEPRGDEYDRALPVFWRVFLHDESFDYTRFVMYDDRDTTDTFPVNAHVAALLRAGSVIVDADPTDTDGGDTTSLSGFAYTVDEVWVDEGTVGGNPGTWRYWVRLRSPLQDDLHCFWVVPPPLDDPTAADPMMWYADQQPVVSFHTVEIPY